ncbi:MAG TPA: hypothetical protein VM782_19475, partial [Stellaceae bacterium]|nr:hypothetical protein [Stellaceae bacterium]
MSECGAIKIVHEDLHQGRAVQIREPRDFADDADVSEALDGFTIFAVLIAYEDDAMDGQFSCVQRREREQRVIDGADTAARRENHGEHELDHHVEHELFLIDGDEDAAGAFDDKPIVVKAGRQRNAIQVDFGTGPARGEIGGNGRNKLVDFVERAIGADAGEAHHGDAVGTFKRAGLN